MPQGNWGWWSRAQTGRVTPSTGNSRAGGHPPAGTRVRAAAPHIARALPVGCLFSAFFFASVSDLNIAFQLFGASAGTRFHPGPFRQTTSGPVTSCAQSPSKGLLEGLEAEVENPPLGIRHEQDIQHQICQRADSPREVWCHWRGWSTPAHTFPIPDLPFRVAQPSWDTRSPAPPRTARSRGGCQALGCDEAARVQLLMASCLIPACGEVWT